MKVELNEITMGVSPTTGRVAVGILKTPTQWLTNVDVTDWFLECVITRFCGLQSTLEASDGKEYKITVVEIKK